jgi:hypothetical protein
MTYHIVALPEKKDLIFLNNLRNYIYQNDFRFKNKPLSSDTHITLTEIDTEDIYQLQRVLQKNASLFQPFTITKEEWELTKENKNPNYKSNKAYTWIALKFPQRKKLFQKLDSITKDLEINRNGEYIRNVKRIEKRVNNNECIANHINLSNFTRREKSNEC